MRYAIKTPNGSGLLARVNGDPPYTRVHTFKDWDDAREYAAANYHNVGRLMAAQLVEEFPRTHMKRKARLAKRNPFVPTSSHETQFATLRYVIEKEHAKLLKLYAHFYEMTPTVATEAYKDKIVPATLSQRMRLTCYARMLRKRGQIAYAQEAEARANEMLNSMGRAARHKC